MTNAFPARRRAHVALALAANPTLAFAETSPNLLTNPGGESHSLAGWTSGRHLQPRCRQRHLRSRHCPRRRILRFLRWLRRQRHPHPNHHPQRLRPNLRTDRHRTSLLQRLLPGTKPQSGNLRRRRRPRHRHPAKSFRTRTLLQRRSHQHRRLGFPGHRRCSRRVLHPDPVSDVL